MAKRTDPYLDSRTASLKGRIPDEVLDEVRTIIDGAYVDGFEDGHNAAMEEVAESWKP